jgi:acetyl-CoA carboxylase carboxyl transferase subunit beta
LFRDFFHKKRKYATVPSGGVKREIPEGLMIKCPKCGAIIFSKELEKNLKVCTSCNYHFKVNARERLAMLMDEGVFTEYDENMVSVDPLTFPGYKKKIVQQMERSGLNDAVITGEGTINGIPAVVAMMSFDFFSGSMGSVVGEKITRAVEAATEKKVPLIIFSTSGGARMQESILSLMQMAKTSAALARFDKEGGLFISVLTDPTLGGVSASFANLADIILAEPGAIIGFAGRIVIEQTIRQQLPDSFQTAEFNLTKGQIDKVVARKDMRNMLGTLIELHGSKEGVSRGE